MESALHYKVTYIRCQTTGVSADVAPLRRDYRLGEGSVAARHIGIAIADALHVPAMVHGQAYATAALYGLYRSMVESGGVWVRVPNQNCLSVCPVLFW